MQPITDGDVCINSERKAVKDLQKFCHCAAPNVDHFAFTAGFSSFYGTVKASGYRVTDLITDTICQFN